MYYSTSELLKIKKEDINEYYQDLKKSLALNCETAKKNYGLSSFLYIYEVNDFYFAEVVSSSFSQSENENTRSELKLIDVIYIGADDASDIFGSFLKKKAYETEITISEKKTVYCDKCEISITYNNWKEHTRTKKHLNYIELRLKKENKEKKINCVCGSILVASSINKHKKSDKHKNFINSNK